MASLFERLNDALTPDFHLERELARGGMGVVFLARDTNLQRRVAIKVLLPEMATQTATERFLREARILAALSHSHIVPVHSVGDADGLNYYVMDYIEGETLADRLGQGPLNRGEALKLGRDLLDALEAVHNAGVVHRDIKPSNIFLIGRRAVLGDFGIAKAPADDTEGLTADGHPIGTPRYMPPEHRRGEEVTPRTDIYAVGMVLYEALKGRPWEIESDPNRETWQGVPFLIAGILRRSLAWKPEDRWPDAKTFRRRLWATRLWRPRFRAARDSALVATVAVVVTVAVVRSLGGPRLPPPGSLTIRLQPFEQTSDVERQWLDSLSQRFERSLRLVSEFRVLPREAPAGEQAGVVLHGVVSSDESGVSLQVWSESRFGLRRSIEVLYSGADWQSVADTVAFRTIRELWSEHSPLARWLPRRALPVTPRGFDAWLQAERLLNSGQWRDAQEAFHSAVLIDSTCVLCSWRIAEVDRWLFARPIDSLHRQRVLDNDHLFPPHFRRLIRARLELTDRLDTLRLATEEWGEYYYAWWLRGEEELNRGPLFGLLRAEAAVSLQRAAVLRPQFAPTWWDLAWIYIAEGDRDGATDALQRVPDPLDQISTLMSWLLQLGYAYRFGEARAANRALQQALADPEIARDPTFLPAGPRLFPSFDAPAGAVQAGETFANISGRPDLRRTGLIAQLFGFFAMGMMDAARERARVFQRDYPGEEGFSLFAAQLEAVNSMFDSVGATGDVERIIGQLERYAVPDAGTLEQRRSARWLLQLLSQRNAAVAVPTAGGALSDSTTGVHPLDLLLEADRMARAGRPQDALRLADTIRRWEIADVVPDRFFRTVLHFLMAEWHTKLGNLQAAVEALRWHEALDLWELPREAPVAQEIDWAFGTLARWKRALLLDSLQDMGGETCSSFGAVARLWGRGDPEYASRAEIAGRRLQELGCIADR